MNVIQNRHNTTDYQVTNTVRLQNGIMNPMFYFNNSFQASVEMLTTINKDYTERDLSSLITDYEITGLFPGEIYGITTQPLRQDLS